MARLVTLLEARTAVRRRSDIENELARFPDVEINDYINAGIAQLHMEVLRLRGQGFGELQTSFPTVAAQEQYVLPAAFLEVLKVFTVINGVERVLHAYGPFETDGLTEPATWDSDLDSPWSYRLVLDSISLRPKPKSVRTIFVNYIASAVKLTTDVSTFDGVDGFEEVAYGWACQLVAMKQGDDARNAAAQGLMGLGLDRIRGVQHARNAAEAPRVQDVRGGALYGSGWRRGSRRWA